MFTGFRSSFTSFCSVNLGDDVGWYGCTCNRVINLFVQTLKNNSTEMKPSLFINFYKHAYVHVTDNGNYEGHLVFPYITVKVSVYSLGYCELHLYVVFDKIRSQY